MKKILRYFISKMFLINLGIAIALSVLVFFITIWSLDSYTDHGESYAVPKFLDLSIEKARKLAEEKDMRIVVADSVYLINEPPRIVLDQTPPPDFRVKKNRQVYVTINMTQPEMVLMPSLTQVSVRQANALAQARGLKIRKLKYVEDQARDYVLGQYFKGKPIEPKTELLKGSYIDLTVGKGEGAQTSVLPQLENMTVEQARYTLIENSLNLGRVIYDNTVKNYRDSSKAKVIRQYPVYYHNKHIAIGSPVDIWVTLK
jgi:beta-lactam-binding protein with PASTA domain